MVNLWKRRLIAKYDDYFRSVKPKELQYLVADQETSDEFNRHFKTAGRYWNAYDRKASLAIQEFKNAIAIMPNNTKGYTQLAAVYLSSDKNELAIETLEKALRMNPYFPEVFFILYQVYYRAANPRLAQDALEKYLYLNPSDISIYLPFLQHGLPLVRDQDVFAKLLKYNLDNVINIADHKKIKLILQNYPDPMEALPGIQSALEGITSKNKISFVDNKLFFHKLKLQEGYKYTDYFNEDTHCNNKGYSIMAENVYNVLIDAKLL